MRFTLTMSPSGDWGFDPHAFTSSVGRYYIGVGTLVGVTADGCGATLAFDTDAVQAELPERTLESLIRESLR